VLFQVAISRVAGNAADAAQSALVTVWNCSIATGGAVGGIIGALGLAATVLLSSYDEHLNAVTLLIALVAAGTVHLRSRRPDAAVVAGAFGVVLLAALAWTGSAIAGLTAPWGGLVGLVALSAVVLARPWVPSGVRTAGTDLAVELTAGVGAALVGAAALGSTPAADLSGWSAVYLTVAGAAATALALTRDDRRPVAWLGGTLLVAATWVRLADLGVHQPEPYTLPAALALIVLGLRRLLRRPDTPTMTALGAGLGLALGPSLLWTLEQPTGPRPVLLGLACLALVVAGARLHWSAPLLHGTVAGLVLVLREAGPYLGDAVPRWGLIGAAGALLIALGVTWEQRLAEARALSTYVRDLR
jgi:hypothetical protein